MSYHSVFQEMEQASFAAESIMRFQHRTDSLDRTESDSGFGSCELNTDLQ